MGEEKRRFVRWRQKVRVAYSLDKEGNSYQQIFTEDLSETGLQILLKDSLQLSQTVRVKLEFVYDSVPIMATARVAYIKAYQNQYRVGLEFINMTDFEKQRLKRILEKIG